jgi:sigma-B regulation protein RsbU (phosphoserine phosphatase)
MFVTAWVGLLDYGTGHVDYVNAGHNPPLLRHGGSWDWMTEKSGMPLGLFDDCEYDTYSVDMEVGDQILLYTDGVTEAFSVRDEQYGEPRLERLVRDEPDLHPRELVDSVRASVAAHAQGAEQSDDITLLALELER